MQPSEYNSGYPNISNCPNCGSTSVQLMLSYSPWLTPASHVLCIDCQMQGPIACSQREEDAIDIQDLECLAEPTGFEITAIAAWNSLPRRPDYNDVDCAGCQERRRSALTWTTDPPKVAGWYWYQLEGHVPEPKKIESSFDGEEYFGVRDGWYVNRITKKPHVKYAGPIPAPLD